MTTLLAAVWLLLDYPGAYWPSWRLPRCTACAESGRGILIRLLASAT